MYRMKSRHPYATAALLACVLVVSTSCSKPPQPFTDKAAREVMGTFAEITAAAPQKQTARLAVDAAYDALSRVDSLMSDYRDETEIGRFNALPAGESMAFSPETYFVLQRSAEFSQASGGAFDITCRPLVTLWKDAGKAGRLPDEPALAAAMTCVGWSKLALVPESRRAVKSVAGMQIDVGAVAKGYALDLAAQAMKRAGATAGLVDVGGDIVAMGTQADGSPWRIGVQHPFHAGLIMKLSLVDCAVATSGNQQRFSMIGGRRYSHIIDPRTGHPAEQAPSVTVIAPDGITADAWATVFSVLSVQEGIEKAGQLPGIEVLWIWQSDNEPRSRQTPGFNRYVIP